MVPIFLYRPTLNPLWMPEWSGKLSLILQVYFGPAWYFMSQDESKGETLHECLNHEEFCKCAKLVS